ncbi:hypothetical protein ABGB18_06345 [Nonomuraea sp. B12E4]|uniref:hypothetical protein n=1 Tax=Nonomuraea sp. B12E4 TaxID=3153564 RepID=UPI00325EA071
MKAFKRFLLSDPLGQSADGRKIGLGLGMALRKQYATDEAERHLHRWSVEHEASKSPQP